MDYVLKGNISRAVSGGTTIGVDETLSISGMAADAKAVGDALKKTATTTELDALDRKIETTAEELRSEFAYGGGSSGGTSGGTSGGSSGSSGSSGGSSDSTAQEALETAQAAKVIAENTQNYVDSLVVVKTVNDSAPDEYGNVKVDCGVKTVNGTAPDENGNVAVEAVAGVDVTEVDFSNWNSGYFTETIGGVAKTHTVTFDDSGIPTKIDNMTIRW